MSGMSVNNLQGMNFIGKRQLTEGVASPQTHQQQPGRLQNDEHPTQPAYRMASKVAYPQMTPPIGWTVSPNGATNTITGESCIVPRQAQVPATPEIKIKEEKNVDDVLDLIKSFMSHKVQNSGDDPQEIKLRLSKEGNLATRRISDILNSITRWVVLKDNTVHINWLKLPKRLEVKKFVFLILQDFNGKELLQQIQQGKLPNLARFNHTHTTVDFQFLKQDNERKLWEAVLECPNLTNEASVESTSRHEQYLVSYEDKHIHHIPTGTSPQYAHYENTSNLKEWPLLKHKSADMNLVTIDCEMVESSEGIEVVKISAIDEDFRILLETYVQPAGKVYNYKTNITGITAETLRNTTITLKDLHKKLRLIIDKDTILLGHGISNDLQALKLVHDRVIDTSILYASKTGKPPGLRDIAFQYVKLVIQQKHHDSMEDAKATLAVYKFKSLIMDRHGLASEGKDFSLIQKIISSYNFCIIDKEGQLDPLGKTGTNVVSVPVNDVQTVTQEILKAWDSGHDCIYAKAELIQQKLYDQQVELEPYINTELSKVDDFLGQLYPRVPRNTMVVITTFGPKTNKFVLSRVTKQSTPVRSEETAQVKREAGVPPPQTPQNDNYCLADEFYQDRPMNKMIAFVK